MLVEIKATIRFHLTPGQQREYDRLMEDMGETPGEFYAIILESTAHEMDDFVERCVEIDRVEIDPEGSSQSAQDTAFADGSQPTFIEEDEDAPPMPMRDWNRLMRERHASCKECGATFKADEPVAEVFLNASTIKSNAGGQHVLVDDMPDESFGPFWVHQEPCYTGTSLGNPQPKYDLA